MTKRDSFAVLVACGALCLGISQGAVASESSYMTVSRPAPTIGVQAGLNFDTATTPGQIGTDTHTGFSAGLVLDVPITSYLSLAPELNYSRRGYNVANVANVRADVFLHTIELPVFLKVGFGETVRPVVFAGPQIVWNVSKEVQGTIGGTTASASMNPKTFDFGAAFGAGVEVGAFFVNARYAMGFVDISNTSAGYYSRGFKLMGGVAF